MTRFRLWFNLALFLLFAGASALFLQALHMQLEGLSLLQTLAAGADEAGLRDLLTSIDLSRVRMQRLLAALCVSGAGLALTGLLLAAGWLRARRNAVEAV